MNAIRKLYDLLNKTERKRAGVLMGMILVMAVLDMIGVASILPFVAVLSNPQLVESNALLNAVYLGFGFNNVKAFFIALGLFMFVLLMGSLAFKAATSYAQTRFVLMREYSIGKRLAEGYLHQPYSWFLNRNSADLGKTILSEVGAVVGNGMFPLMTLIGQGAVAIALLALLLFVDPYLSIFVGIVLGGAYSLFYITMGERLKHLGQARMYANKQRFTALSEAFGAAKDVKLGGLEQVYIERFAKPAEAYAKGQATAQAISQLPRYALEAIAFGGMLLVILYLLARSGSFTAALPVIALYAFAGYRLMPALQQIYGAITQLRYAGPALDALHLDIKSLREVEYQSRNSKQMQLTNSIELQKIFFSYPNTASPSIKGLNIIIPSNTKVGFVGATGSGKTTTIDLILGLLEPQEGTLRVDGKIINDENRREWQSAIGYVPQQIYLSDDTVAANIAFGLECNKVDLKAVERAAKIANLHDFVVNDLPQGYQTFVGERGVRLSGGQRQRIGIARALYHCPQVLILDEATSALDNITEQAVMEAVNNLGREITVILIAHRLSTVRHCDQIYLLERGELKDKGSYEELMTNNHQFAKMAKIA